MSDPKHTQKSCVALHTKSFPIPALCNNLTKSEKIKTERRVGLVVVTVSVDVGLL